MTDPSVGLVVLNWNNYEDTSACLDSLENLSYGDYSVFVVDNGSTDGSGERIDEEYDETVVFSDENRGFAGGMNLGIRHAIRAGAEYVWLLNNDVVISDDDVLTKLIEVFETNDGVGILSPVVHQYPETDMVWFERGDIDWRSCNATHGTGPRLVDLRLRRRESPVEKHDGYYTTEYLPFCSALVSRDVIESVGALPEDFFLYYEDADFCTQLRQQGYQVGVVPDAKICHRVGSSSDDGAIHKYYYARNRILFARRHDAVSPEFVIVYLWWFVLTVVHQIAIRQLRSIAALITGVVHGVRGRSGKGPYP